MEAVRAMPLAAAETRPVGGGGASGGIGAGRSATCLGSKCGGTHVNGEHVKDVRRYKWIGIYGGATGGSKSPGDFGSWSSGSVLCLVCQHPVPSGL